MVGGRLRTRHLFILIHNGGEGLKHSGRCEIYVGRPLSQEEQSESSAKSSEHAASAKHQLYPLKSGSKSIEASKQLKSDVKSICKEAEQDFVNALTLSTRDDLAVPKTN